MSDTAAPFHYDIVGSSCAPKSSKTARAQFAEGAISRRRARSRRKRSYQGIKWPTKKPPAFTQ